MDVVQLAWTTNYWQWCETPLESKTRGEKEIPTVIPVILTLWAEELSLPALRIADGRTPTHFPPFSYGTLEMCNLVALCTSTYKMEVVVFPLLCLSSIWYTDNTIPVPEARESLWKTGWKDCKRQRNRKFAVESCLLEMSHPWSLTNIAA